MIYKILYLISFLVYTKSDLKFVLEVFRHGARYPLDADPSHKGELTEVG